MRIGFISNNTKVFSINWIKALRGHAIRRALLGAISCNAYHWEHESRSAVPSVVVQTQIPSKFQKVNHPCWERDNAWFLWVLLVFRGYSEM